MRVVILVALALAVPSAASAQVPEIPEALRAEGAQAPSLPADDPGFGPRIEIEDIDVHGNRVTAARVIERALPLQRGDVLRAGDPRLRDAQFKVMALGFFRDVELSLRKGSRRGRVVLEVRVVERGTIVLNRLYFGVTEAVPWWVGADVGDRNFLGSGVEVGAAAVYAGESDVIDGQSQWAAQLRVGVAGIAGTQFGVHGAFTHVDASEPYRIAGDADDGSPNNFAAFPYRRTGAAGGVGIDVTPLSNVSIDARVDFVDASVPAAPVRVLPSGAIEAVDLDLRDGDSRVVGVSVGFDRDTRPDPILPFTGDRFVVIGELGASWLGGDYDFASAVARYERWFPVSGVQHVVSVHVTGGIVLGDAPRFDLFYVGDVDRLLTPRALGLVLTTLPALNLLDDGADDVVYGQVVGLIEGQYAYRLFRTTGPIYGGDLFVAGGAFGLAQRDEFRFRDTSLWRAIPVDLVFDVGLRLDTEVGIFELTFANALGRIPL